MACWKTVLIALAIFGVCCILIGVILQFAVFPDVVVRRIEENARLEMGTTQFHRWKNFPFPVTFNIYFFEVKNPQEILSGSKPSVAERGPYVYRQTRRKRDIKFTEYDDTLFYYEDMWFQFDAHASHPLDNNDTILALNVPLMSTFQLIELYAPEYLSTANDQWEEAFPQQGLFHKFTVKDYLFKGVKFCSNPSLTICLFLGEKVEKVKMLEKGEDGIKFAFLGYRNNADDGSYLIRAGIDNIEDLGMILEWRNSSYLNIWGEDNICRNVRGRDSTIYPPQITSDDVFDIFRSDICRVITMEYVRNAHFSMIPGYRQEPKADTLTNTGDQSCYCSKVTKGIHGDTKCWPDGFMDLFECIGSTMVMSYPHFLKADKELAHTVEGLRPGQVAHSTFVVFEPNTGTVLRSAIRTQYNMVLRPIKSNTHNIAVTEKLRGAVLPLIWIEEEIELPSDLIRELREQHFNQILAMEVITFVLIGFGILLSISSGILMCVC